MNQFSLDPREGNKKGRAKALPFVLSYASPALLGGGGLDRIRGETAILRIGRVDHLLTGAAAAARTGAASSLAASCTTGAWVSSTGAGSRRADRVRQEGRQGALLGRLGLVAAAVAREALTALRAIPRSKRSVRSGRSFRS